MAIQYTNEPDVSSHVSVNQPGDSVGVHAFSDNRPEAVAQKKMKDYIRHSPVMVAQREIIQRIMQGTVQRQESVEAVTNNTGLPDSLKTGIETLSGIAMDDVKVHYGSDKPAQLNAHAYAQGTDIHVAAGQEQHLPHEAWHVVQQKEGRVKPTMQLHNVAINDDSSLEKEADVMGNKALGG